MLATAINEKGKLPKFIVCILDVDLIEYINFESYGISILLGEGIEWLVKEFKDMIETCKSQLPSKAVKPDYPQVYWMAAPLHMNFDETSSNARKKLNMCLHSIMKQEPNMQVM